MQRIDIIGSTLQAQVAKRVMKVIPDATGVSLGFNYSPWNNSIGNMTAYVWNKNTDIIVHLYSEKSRNPRVIADALIAKWREELLKKN